jgi:DNA-binding Xre family transcriptional regulator
MLGSILKSMEAQMDMVMTSGTVRLRIKAILDGRGISIVEAAKMTGLTYNTMAGFYRGIYVRIGTETIAALCDGLKVDPGDLFEYSPSTPDL